MVKKIIIVLLAAMVCFQASFAAIADERAKDNSSQIIAYYFHGTFRCPTCHKLEKYAKEAIEDNFKDELDKGILIFKAVNIEEKRNEHFINDYQLYTKSIVLSLVKEGKEIEYKNLDKIWEYVRDKDKYIKYVKSEIEDFLRKL